MLQNNTTGQLTSFEKCVKKFNGRGSFVTLEYSNSASLGGDEVGSGDEVGIR